MSPNTLTNFHGCTFESILTSFIMVWYGNYNAQEREWLQRVVDSAQCITAQPSPPSKTSITSRRWYVSSRIPTNQAMPLSLLPSDIRFRYSYFPTTTHTTQIWFKQRNTARLLHYCRVGVFFLIVFCIDIFFCNICFYCVAELMCNLWLIYVFVYVPVMWCCCEQHFHCTRA